MKSSIDRFTTLLVCLIVVLGLKFEFAFGLNVAVKRETNDKEMLLAFVINRHGERTPAEEEAALSDDLERLKEAIGIDGYEALTNLGKRKAYQLGKFFRQRYCSSPGLLSQQYLKDESYLRCAAKDRTQMTVQISMAALYSPEPVQQWDDGLGRIWQPIPYVAVPLSEDYLRYYSNCKYYKTLMQQAKDASLNEELASYLDLVPLLKEKTGQNFTEDPLLFETLFDLFSSQVHLGIPIPTWAKPLMPRLNEAARLAYRLYFRTEEMKKIGGGVILDQFMEAANAIIAGEPVAKRFRLFTSADFNIGAMMDVSKVEGSAEMPIPAYASLFALELHRCKKSGEYFVLPVYLPAAGQANLRYLKISGCEDSFCEYEKFRNQSSPYRLPEKEFYPLCGLRTEL